MRGEIALVTPVVILPYVGAGRVYAYVRFPALTTKEPGARTLASVRYVIFLAGASMGE